jgi:hypothetical protein
MIITHSKRCRSEHRGHAFTQTLRQGHYELATHHNPNHRLPNSFRRTRPRRLNSAQPQSSVFDSFQCDNPAIDGSKFIGSAAATSPCSLSRRSCRVRPQCRRRGLNLGECPGCGCLDADMIENGATSRFWGYPGRPRRRNGHHRGLSPVHAVARPALAGHDEPDDFPDIAAHSGTDLGPREVLGNHSTLAPALHMGDCQKIFETDPATGKEILWLLAANSWASVTDGQVRQADTRKLWDEAVTAYQW